MITYRKVQDFQRMMNDLQKLLRSAILATNTRDMVQYSDDAQALAVNLKSGLAQMVDDEDDEDGESNINPTLVRAAYDSTESALLDAQKVALGTTVDEMRDRLLAFKTWADWADAYLRAALGFELE
jgi:hypothetical protein